MKTYSTRLLAILLGVCALQIATPVAAQNTLVHNTSEFNRAVKSVKPGNKIILANGVWKDVELIFEGSGTKEKPIVLSVETKGKVTLEGKSNFKMAGKYLMAEGLVFKNGYSTAAEVIAFRKNDSALCNNCRITEFVVDNYSNPQRFNRIIG